MLSHHRIAIVSAAVAALLLAGCGTQRSSESTAVTTSGGASVASPQPASAALASGTALGAPPGGSGGSSASYPATGSYVRTSGTAVVSGRTITSSTDDRSGVLASGGTKLTLQAVRVITSGNSKSSDQSSFYGLNAGVLAKPSAKVSILGGSVSTSGAGANDVFAYGTGSGVLVKHVTIEATGNYAHGIMASGGGRVTAANTTIRTAGASSAAIATDRGGGTITVSGGTMTTTGYRSPGIYSTGTITVTGANINATGSEAAVIEGKNSILVRNSKLSGTKNRGVMLYQSMSGDAGVGTASYQMIGGSLYAAQGPAFYITNTTAKITLRSGALVRAASGVLLRADNAGTGSGNTGAGVATLTASAEKLTGDIVTAGTGSASISLTNATTLTGSITRAALILDRTSTWTVASNSQLTAFSDHAAISGNQILNVVGNGHTVTYDASLAANKALGGNTYQLTGGGTLAPAQ
jgi:hypothetical protein